MAGQPQSKWLREDGDDAWEQRIGANCNSQRDFRGDNPNNNEAINQLSVFRDERGKGTDFGVQKSSLLRSANLKGFITNSNILNGVEDEERDIFQLEERKRRRGDSGGLGHDIPVMGFPDTGPNKKTNNDGAGISDMDLAAPTDLVLAELARQASQLK